MIRKKTAPTIRYVIDDEDAIVSTTYVVLISYSKCPGYPATWGYNGGSPGERNHVEDISFDELVSVEMEGREVKVDADAAKRILATLEEHYEGCEAIDQACYDAAFAEGDCDHE